MRQISDLLELLNRCVAGNRIAELHQFLGAAGARQGPAGSPAQAHPRVRASRREAPASPHHRRVLHRQRLPA